MGHQRSAASQRGRVDCTLLELVQAVGESSSSEQETIATLQHLVRSGRVRLVGALRDEAPSF